MPQVFQSRRFVEFSDTDMAGIAHFSAFFRYMESAEHALLRSLGLSVHHKLEDGVAVSFPRVSAACDYTSPAYCEDDLDIQVTIERLGTKSVSYAFQFYRDETPIARGKMTSVCCKLEADKPPVAMPIPDEVADKLRPFLIEA